MTNRVRLFGQLLKKAGEILDDKPSEEALLTEYQVCEADNAANFQGYWTLAAIFFGISSALLAGITYGVLSNEHLFNVLFCNNEPHKTLTAGVIAILLTIANIIILKKLKGWHTRAKFNQSVNLGRMTEIEFKLGMNRWWRILVLDAWSDIEKEKNYKSDTESEFSEEKWEDLKNKIKKNYPKLGYHEEIGKKHKKEAIQLINFYFSVKNKRKYASPSSEKYFPCILNTLMSLWVIVLALGVFLTVFAYGRWWWGLLALVIGSIGYLIYLLFKWVQLNKGV